VETKVALAIAPLAAVLLAGCQSSADPNHVPGGYFYSAPKNVFGSTSSVRLADLWIGMTKEEVQWILGPPASTSSQANAEYLVYNLELPAHVAIYNREPLYVVRMVSGKVESFGGFVELYDLYLRPVTQAPSGQPGFPQAGFSPGGPLPPGMTVVSSGAPAPRTDMASELERLKALKDQGVLSEEEFQRAKSKLLAQP